MVCETVSQALTNNGSCMDMLSTRFRCVWLCKLYVNSESNTESSGRDTRFSCIYHGESDYLRMILIWNIMHPEIGFTGATLTSPRLFARIEFPWLREL